MINYFVVSLLIFNLSWGVMISGFVRDCETNKSIPNANIIVKDTEYGTASDPYGHFKLDLPRGNYSLEFSMIGFKTHSKNISVNNNNLELDIQLKTTFLECNEIRVQGLFTTRLGYESVDIINSNKIKSTGKESVSDILRDIPGVDVQFAHPNGRNVNVSIRGSSDYKPGGYNNRVLILLDGFPILIPNSGTPDWNSLPLESLERIEVENSPASTQYGHNSMGGVINLITEKGTKSSNTKIILTGGSFFKKQISITHNNYKGNWQYGINSMMQTSKGHRFNADTIIGRLRTYFRYADLKGRTYKLSHIVSYSDIGHPGFYSIPSYRKSKRTSHYLQGRGFYPITNGFSMSHSVFINKFDTQYFSRVDSPVGYADTNKTTYDDLTVGFRSEMLITKWSRWIVMTGTDVDWSRSDVDVFNLMYDIPTQLSTGLFVQSKYSIGGGWNFGSGLRFDYRKSTPGSNYKNRIFSNWSPKFNIVYESHGKRAFTLAYSEGFRAPSLSELYLYYESSYGLTTKGNPNLTSEKVKAIELTYEHPHSNSLFWSISIFHNQYKNMIDFVYNIPVLAINRRGVTGTGFDYQVNWKPTKIFKLMCSYSYLDMSDQDNEPILYRSKHRGHINLYFQTNPINIQLGINVWTKQIYEDFLSGNHFDFPIQELPGRIIPELIFSKEIKGITGSLRISNLLNEEYELIQDFPMPRRAWQLTITKTLNKER